jgi:RNase P subunit RPR2
MRITPVQPISGVNHELPKKQLTVTGCCDKVVITGGTTTVMFGKHKFYITVVHCATCGQVKATSNIKEKK